MPCRTISIVFHETTRHEQMLMYRVVHYARHWQQAGIEIRLHRGMGQAIEADLVIPQIDLSVMPENYRGLLALHTQVVNRRITDISKTGFSRNLLSPGDDYAGPVIVKTNANYGGQPEAKLATRQAAPDGQAQATTLDPARYPIFPRLTEVPDDIQRDPALIIEKFLPETDGQYFYLRSYAFFGNRELAVRSRSTHPVVKGANSTDAEFIPVHKEIAQAREALGFDSGKFDYVVHKGKAILLDINDTPTFGQFLSPTERRHISRELAGGLSAWF